MPKEAAGGSCWVIEEREAEAVRQIFAWYTGGEKLTIWAITERLNQSYSHALRRAKTWQYSIVHKILKRTTYIGLTHFNKERILPEVVGTPRLTGRGKRRAAQTETRPKEEWIEIEVPALVDEVVWNRAQDRLVQVIVPFGVSYQSEPELIRRLAVETGFQHPLVLAEPEPVMLFKGFADSSLDFNLLVSVKQPEMTLVIMSDLYFMLWKVFADNDIEIPFPQRDLNLANGWEKLEQVHAG